MRPTKRNDDALVDLLDVILVEGVVLQADLIITVADIPLVGLQLRAVLAGMDTMTEYGLFEEWDRARRKRAMERGETDSRKKSQKARSLGSKARNAGETEAESSAPTG